MTEHDRNMQSMIAIVAIALSLFLFGPTLLIVLAGMLGR